MDAGALAAAGLAVSESQLSKAPIHHTSPSIRNSIRNSSKTTTTPINQLRGDGGNSSSCSVLHGNGTLSSANKPVSTWTPVRFLAHRVPARPDPDISAVWQHHRST